MLGARELWYINLEERIKVRSAELADLPPPRKRKGPIIFLVGSSLLHEAAASTVELGRRISPDAKVVIYARPSAPAAWVSRILPVLARAHPDLIVLEHDLVSPFFEDQNFGFMDSLYFAVSMLRHGTAYAPRDDGWRVCWGRRKSLPEALQKFSAIRVSDPASLTELTTIKELRQQGIRVVIIGMPRAREFEEARPDLRRWRKQIEAAMRAEGFAVWIPPSEWTRDDFCDYSHLNDRGRVRFEPWFASRIVQELDRAK